MLSLDLLLLPLQINSNTSTHSAFYDQLVFYFSITATKQRYYSKFILFHHTFNILIHFFSVFFLHLFFLFKYIICRNYSFYQHFKATYQEVLRRMYRMQTEPTYNNIQPNTTYLSQNLVSQLPQQSFASQKPASPNYTDFRIPIKEGYTQFSGKNNSKQQQLNYLLPNITERPQYLNQRQNQRNGSKVTSKIQNNQDFFPISKIQNKNFSSYRQKISEPKVYKYNAFSLLDEQWNKCLIDGRFGGCPGNQCYAQQPTPNNWS